MSESQMKWKREGGENPLLLDNTLFRAVLTEFAAHSFRDASLNDMLREAGMHKGSFYYRFYGKMDLYLSLFDRMAKEKLEMLSSFGMLEKPGGFFDTFRKMTEMGLRFARKEPLYRDLWSRISQEEPSVLDAVTAEFGDQSNSILTHLIEAGKTAGEIRPDVPTDIAARMLTTFLRLDMFSPRLEDEEILETVDRFLNLIRYGLGT